MRKKEEDMDKGFPKREDVLTRLHKGHPIQFLLDGRRLTVQIHTRWNDVQTFHSKYKPFHECPYCQQPLVSCLRHYSITPSPAEVNTSEHPSDAKEQDNGN